VHLVFNTRDRCNIRETEWKLFYDILQCFITLVLLIIKDVYVLINYLSFVEALFTTLSVSGLLWLRYKRPDAERPIKVNFIFRLGYNKVILN